jgi:pentatricopeptide repeat protein
MSISLAHAAAAQAIPAAIRFHGAALVDKPLLSLTAAPACLYRHKMATNVVAPEGPQTLPAMSQMRPTRRTRQLMVAGLLVFFFLSAFFQVSDVDVGYHLRTGAYILEGRGIPTTNTFSSTVPESPWMLQQWPGAVFFCLAFTLGGVKSLITIKALVAVLILFLTWRRATAETGPESWWPFWVVSFGAVATRMRFFERPDLLSALFFALVLYCDRRGDNRRRWQWLALPALIALWANVHSGVIYGVVFLATVSGAEWLEWFWNHWKIRRTTPESGAPASSGWQKLFIRPVGVLLSVSAACLAVQLVNPNGCRVLWVPIAQFTSPFWQSIILEYHSPTWAGARAFYCFLAGLVGLQALTFKKLNLRSFLVSLVFGFLALRSQRSILFFIIAAAPHASMMLEQLLPHHAKREAGVESEQVSQSNRARRFQSLVVIQPVLLVALWLGTVAAVFIPDQTFRFGTGWYQPYYPLEIYKFIQTEVPPQNIFNEMRYGGSMLWWLYPRFKPFIDGRGDAYSVQFWKTDYIPVLQARPGWQDIFGKYHVTAALLPIYEDRTLPPLARTLHDDPDWALVAFNDHTLFFLRRTDANHDIIARHEFRRIWPGDWSLAAIDTLATRGEAAAEAKRAFEFSPDGLFVRTATARVYFVNEQYGSSIELLRDILYKQDGGANYLRDFGYALFRTGQFKEADRVFKRMIRGNLLPGFAWYMRHAIALQEKRYADARAALAEAIRLEPDNADYRGALGRLDMSPPRQ